MHYASSGIETENKSHFEFMQKAFAGGAEKCMRHIIG